MRIQISLLKEILSDPSAVDFTKDGTYKPKWKVCLSIKGKEQKYKIPGTIVVNGGNLSGISQFFDSGC